MTLFELPPGDPDPERHQAPPRRINPDHLVRADIEYLLPGLDIDHLTPHERAVVRQVIAGSLQSPAELCNFRGCTRPAVHLHHTLPRAVGGRLAEYAPKAPYCELHHEFAHIVDRRRNDIIRVDEDDDVP